MKNDGGLSVFEKTNVGAYVEAGLSCAASLPCHFLVLAWEATSVTEETDRAATPLREPTERPDGRVTCRRNTSD